MIYNIRKRVANDDLSAAEAAELEAELAERQRDEERDRLAEKTYRETP